MLGITMFTKSAQFTGVSEAFREDKAHKPGPEWLARLRSLDTLFRKLILWAFFLCVLGVVAINTTNP